MDGLIQPGDTLRMERAGAPLATEKRIGEGGQGVVHVARLNGTPFAVKWFRPTREAAIIDVDNVGVDGGSALVKGTRPFMAPELLRDEALPSTVTDLHSLAVLFYDPEQAGQSCWSCSAPLPVPLTLRLRGSLLVLSEDAVLTSHHLNRDRDYRTACAVVEPDPRQPGRSVLRNLTDRTWTVVPDGEEPKRVAPNQRLGVRPMRIDFGPARGQIR